jgi:hypothetical protein
MAERGNVRVFMVFFLVHPLDQQNGASTLDAGPVILGKLVKFVI